MIIINITVYDSLYIAQAKEHKAKLLTSNARQKNVADKLGVETMYAR